jgi:hypothetical protein
MEQTRFLAVCQVQVRRALRYIEVMTSCAKPQKSWLSIILSGGRWLEG